MDVEFKKSLQGLLGAVGPDLMVVTRGQLRAVSKQGNNQSVLCFQEPPTKGGKL